MLSVSLESSCVQGICHTNVPVSQQHEQLVMLPNRKTQEAIMSK